MFATSETTLSAFLERVKAGETITVTEHGRPIARLVRDEPISDRLLELAAQGQVTLPTKPIFTSSGRTSRTSLNPWPIEDLMDEVR